MKTTKRYLLIIAWLCLGFCVTIPKPAFADIPTFLLETNQKPAWPASVEHASQALYQSKVATMGCRGMRLREEEPETGRTGYLRGEAFNRGIDQLAALADENLLERAKKFEEVDVIAKFHRHPIGFPEFE